LGGFGAGGRPKTRPKERRDREPLSVSQKQRGRGLGRGKHDVFRSEQGREGGRFVWWTPCLGKVSTANCGARKNKGRGASEKERCEDRKKKKRTQRKGGKETNVQKRSNKS